MCIFEDEVLDDLQIGNLKLIQKKKGFKFGTDAVLLSDFAKNIPSDNTLDLCTGSGIIPVLLSAKTNTGHFSGVEIQKDIADMAQRSVKINELSQRIDIKCMDLKNACEVYEKRSFELICCNPPYMRRGSAILNESDSKLISRHEVMCTLEDIIKVMSQLVCVGGRVALIHRPTRLTDLLYLMRKYELEPKKIRFVQKTAMDAPFLFMTEGLYKGNSDIEIMPPLILYDKEGNKSEELNKIYGIGCEN